MSSQLNDELIQEPDAAPIKAWVRGVPLEAQARRQLITAARIPFIYKWLAVVPDVHLGIGATAGIECRKDSGVIDETPAAYKDIDAVMAAQNDLVEIVHTLRTVVCVKG